MTDEEVITVEIRGEYFGFSKAKAAFDYFRAHYQSFFHTYEKELGLYGKRLTYGISRFEFNNG